MRNIKESIDNRIKSLEDLRKSYLKSGDIAFANQMWARLEELKAIKKPFTDREGNWKDE